MANASAVDGELSEDVLAVLESGERLTAACTRWADAADNIDVGTSAQLLNRSKAVLYAVLSSDCLSALAAPRINGVDGESGSFKLRRLDSKAPTRA